MNCVGGWGGGGRGWWGVVSQVRSGWGGWCLVSNHILNNYTRGYFLTLLYQYKFGNLFEMSIPYMKPRHPQQNYSEKGLFNF
jgi:hypothetical protein